MRTVTYKGLTFEPYINNNTISERINEIANSLAQKLGPDEKPLFLCVLTGAFPFAADLFRAYPYDAEIAFIRLKSYEGTGSTGVVKQVLGLSENIENRTVIIIEDIIDTGNTMVKLVADLKQKNPKQVLIATLLFKPESLVADVKPDFIGFEIPSKFIIGFGLDLDGMARNLPDIWVLSEKHDE